MALGPRDYPQENGNYELTYIGATTTFPVLDQVAFESIGSWILLSKGS
jgi:hypothetical protein